MLKKAHGDGCMRVTEVIFFQLHPKQWAKVLKIHCRDQVGQKMNQHALCLDRTGLPHLRRANYDPVYLPSAFSFTSCIIRLFEHIHRYDTVAVLL